MRRTAKLCAEALLGSKGAARVLTRWSDPVSLVLAFHNVLPEREPPRGDRSLHLPISSFREILDWLPEVFELVPLDVVFREPDEFTIRPRAAITFDDAYVGVVSEAIPELERRGIPATIFAVTGVHGGHTFWWDALADGYAGGLPEALREAALTEARGRGEEVGRWAAERSLTMSELSGPFVSAPWAEIERVEMIAGIEVASHTRTHANLAALYDDELDSELADARTELTARIPGARPWLAWPYGRSSEAAEEAAQRAGYEFALRVGGGTRLRREGRPSPFRLPRLNVPAGLSLAGFRLRAAGLLGR